MFSQNTVKDGGSVEPPSLFVLAFIGAMSHMNYRFNLNLLKSAVNGGIVNNNLFKLACFSILLVVYNLDKTTGL